MHFNAAFRRALACLALGLALAGAEALRDLAADLPEQPGGAAAVASAGPTSLAGCRLRDG